MDENDEAATNLGKRVSDLSQVLDQVSAASKASDQDKTSKAMQELRK